MPEFKVEAPFEPTGDQPDAIAGRDGQRQDVYGGEDC